VNTKQYILPGFVDSHIHIESSMLIPEKFAKIAVKHGTVAVVSDPHEIANVCGIDGINFMIENAKKADLKFFFGAPSCVPASQFETSGAIINSEQITSLLKRNDIYYLSEMMNFPGVINDDNEIQKKISAALIMKKNIDGHAPGLSKEQLSKYINSGITTDHECTTIEEAIEKIENGMSIQIREGSAAKNFDLLYKLIETHPDSVMLCSDDLHPDDLALGHINLLVKKARMKNIALFKILKSAILNPIKHYKLPVGLLQKGDFADFIIVNNLTDFTITDTFINGKNALYLNNNEQILKPINNFHCNFIEKSDLLIQRSSRNVRVIHAFDGDLITRELQFSLPLNQEFDLNNDILKITILNRYSNSEKPISAFVHGFGLKYGAIASSVAHDSHNIIAVGTNDEDITNAINLIIAKRGGVAFYHGQNFDILPLPFAGLMSDLEPEVVGEKYKNLNNYAVINLQSTLKNPFMTLAFMALPVIPDLKITDKGLFDVRKFEFTSLNYE
jgi:adenine deaminase